MTAILTRPVYVMPSAPRVTAGGTVTFTATGGTGSSCSYSFQTNLSGGNVSGDLYTAGDTINVTDTILCTDAAGNTGTRDVVVTDDASSLANIRTECKQRTDLINSNFITDDEWNRMINKSAYALYDIIVAAYGNDYNLAPPYQFQTDGITQLYPLPPDLFKLKALDVQISNTQSGWLPVPKFNFSERNKFMTPYQIFYGIRTNLHYRVRGNHLWLLPIAAAGQWLQAHFVPKMTRLVNDTDVMNGLSGWEEFVIADVCAKACTKREVDPSEFLNEMQLMNNRIQVIAEERDIGTPDTVADVRAQQDDDMFRGGSGGSL